MSSIAPPRAALAGRYRYSRSLPAGPKAWIWLAIDDETRALVVASALGRGRLASLAPGVGVRHDHLAPLLDVVHDPDPDQIPGGTRVQAAAVGIAEFVPGGTLHDQLRLKRLTAWDAATWFARLADALAELHASGAAHGAISPRSIVIAPEGRSVRPVLTQLQMPPSGSYCTPERVDGAPPSVDDDLWALCSSLYAALAGASPFEGATRVELLDAMKQGNWMRLRDLGAGDEALDALLELGLAPERSQRLPSAASVRDRLAEWARRAAEAEWTDEDRPLTGNQQRLEPEVARLAPLRESVAPLGSIVPASSVFPQQSPGFYSTRPGAPDSSRQPAVPDVRAPAPAVLPAPVLGRSEPAPPSDREIALALPSSVHAPAPSEPAPAPLEVAVAQDQETVPLPPVVPVTAPPSSAPATAATVSPEPEARPAAPVRAAPRAQSRPWLPPAVVGAAVVAAGLWFGLRPTPAAAPVAGPSAPQGPVTQGPPTAAPATAAPTVATPATAPSAAHAAAATTSAPSAREAPRNVDACVRLRFPEDTFRSEEHLGFVCTTPDLRDVTSTLHKRIVLAGTGKLTQGMKEWSMLGIYQLAAAATVQLACCPDSDLILPEVQSACDPLVTALTRGLTPPVPAAEIHDRVGTLDAALDCPFRLSAPRAHRYALRPSGAQRLVFESFLRRAATP